MPSFDITAARAEVMAERDPVRMRLGGEWYEFPGAMPAEVEFAQMEVARKVASRPDSAPAIEEQDQLMRVAFGDEVFRDLEARRCSPMEMQLGLGELLKYWNAPFQDPNVMGRVTGLMLPGENGTGKNSSPPSSTSSPSSRPTSSASIASTSPGQSSQNGSPGADLSRSTRASPQRR